MEKTLTICIPVYNFDIRPLLEELQKQIAPFQGSVDLLIIDDKSSHYFRELNKNNASKHTYIELEQNIGRSAIRNLLAKTAEGTYLLFLDCDVIVDNHNFIEVYLNELHTDSSIICGGRKYPSLCPSPQQALRWKYGIKRESQGAYIRSKAPNRSFMTNNFLIQKSVFDTIQFDERLDGYGHEDTLFGILLAIHGITIRHIENPVMNGDIESSDEFIEKTIQGLQNLVRLQHITPPELHNQLVHHITLLQFEKTFPPRSYLIRLLFPLFRSILLRNLRSHHPSLTLFNLFKLGEYLTIKKK
jgi:glycosyltransferase involved in cell wall biosynthesis